MPPPVPPPPSNEALNGTVIDPLDQWQPNTPRYGHQQVSGCMRVGGCLFCGCRISRESKEEGIERSEDGFGYEQSGEMGGGRSFY